MCRALRRLQLHLQSFEAKARGDRAGCGLASICSHAEYRMQHIVTNPQVELCIHSKSSASSMVCLYTS